MDAIVKFETNAAGELIMTGMHDGEYRPATVKTHAMLEALSAHFPDLMATVHGRNTDGDRYRAIKDFGLLAHDDKARFEHINEQLQAYEEANGIIENTPRTDVQHDAYIDH